MSPRISTSSSPWINRITWILSALSFAIASEAPAILYSPPPYMTGKKGSSIRLSCRASGTPTPSLAWVKDGVRLQPTQRISMFEDALMISNLGDEDVGRYKCRFTNSFGHATSTTALVLEGGALITAPPMNLTVNNGEGVNLRCEASARPSNITYTWYKDGVNINHIRKISTKSSIGEDGSLSITTVGESDSGVYRCTVSNGLGAPMSAEAHLTVTFTPQVDQTQLGPFVNIPLGGTGTVPCPVKGYPPVTHVVWAKLQSTINVNSPRFEVTPEFSLLIHNVYANDSGWYTCTPHNEYGPGVQSDIMNVYVLDPPKFTIRPEPVYTLKIHSSIAIPCAAESSRTAQLSMTWRKKHGQFPADADVHRLGNVTIKDVQKEDSGIYECIASDGDISSVVATELVIENTTPHSPTNVTALFGHFDIRISWNPGFDGGFTQTYVVQFRESGRANGNWQILPDHGQDTQYTIYGLIPETEYEIRIQPKNQIGVGQYSATVTGKTLGYTPGALGSLPTNAENQVMFPSIIKPLGPAPSPPENFSVQYDEGDAVGISWDRPLETEVPILYYRIEYRTDAESEWSLGSPVLADTLFTSFVPEDVEPGMVTKYYFRVRAYGLLAYSDYSDAIIIYFPKETAVEELSLGAKIGIGAASLFFVGLLIAVIVILCDLKPSKDKRKHDENKNVSQAHYSLAPQTPTGASEWQSFYPYHGGRFAINGEADNIYVIDSQKENAQTNSSTDRDGSVVRHEQGWYFPRDGHPERDLTRTYDSSSTDKGPPPHGINYTANYSNYNGLLHGYYDARTGTQISPSVINYPHSGLGASDVTDGLTGSRHHIRVPPVPTVRRKPLNTLSSRSESHPIYANQVIMSQNADPNWFAPHSQVPHGHTSTMSPISLSYDREQEIVLKPSLPRHSSMRPSIQVPPDDDEVPFDPSLSIVRESSVHNIPVDHSDYDFHTHNQYPYTNGWVESQKPEFSKGHTLHGQTFRQKGYEYPARLREYHTLVSNGVGRAPLHPHHPMVARHALERGSSVSSSVNEMRTHYNRDRLLGTVERVRSTSSRSRRPGSLASVSSRQLSPQVNGYVHSPLPPPYELTECYPEMVSPVYYNNNNNRQPDVVPSRITNRQTSRNQALMVTSPRYENSGLLTSTKYQAPAFAHDNSAGPSRLSTSANATSGLGSTWSPSKFEGGQRRSRPSWSRSSAPTPYEYDMSCESSPAVVLPQFLSTSGRYNGQYSKPKYINSQNPKQSPTWRQHSKTSYDPSFLLGYDNHQLDKSHQLTPQSSSMLPPRAPSDSVDENYEFDPILIDSEPQNFFHIHSVDIPEQVESESTSSQSFQRPSLYAEQPTPPAFRSSQRFSRLRDEYNTFKEQQNSAKRRMALSRLESDIL